VTHESLSSRAERRTSHLQSVFSGQKQTRISIAGSLSALRRIGMTVFMRSVPLVIGTAVLCATTIAADPASVAQQTRAWRTQHERGILQEFSDLLAIPNLASDIPNIERNAAAIRALCEKRSLTTQLLSLEGAPPIVVADLVAPNAKRTIAVYAHYDGQPVDASRWKNDPWRPVMRDRAGHDVDWRMGRKRSIPSGAFTPVLPGTTKRQSSGCWRRSTPCVPAGCNRRSIFGLFSKVKKKRARRISRSISRNIPRCCGPTPGFSAMALCIKAEGWSCSSAPAARSISS